MTARTQAIAQLNFSLDRHGIVPEDRLFSASKRGSNFCYGKSTCPWILRAGIHKVKFKFQIRGIGTAKSEAPPIRPA
jgi:hypothetical protein